MKEHYRKGAIGALADEYEKALDELKDILTGIDEQQFVQVIDETVEKDFQSVRSIVLHIIRSGYVYANHIRRRFGEQSDSVDLDIHSKAEMLSGLDKMFQYTLETFNNKWLLSDDELLSTIIKTSWSTYDLEALIEHAIVHVLRHRLQIQKLLMKQF